MKQKYRYIILFLVIIFSSNNLLLKSEIADEYELKAAFLEKFSRMIEWPTDYWSVEKSEYFEIVVLGDNPFGKKLDQLYSQQKIKNRPVKIRYIQSMDEIGSCQILFISPSMNKKIPQIINKIGQKAILTVSQVKGFCEIGGHINFYIAASKIKFQINDKATKKVNIKISHLLLQYATIVNTAGGENEKNK